MKKLTLAFANPIANSDSAFELAPYLAHSHVERILWLRTNNAAPAPTGAKELAIDAYFSGAAIRQLLATCMTEYLLLILPGGQVTLDARALERFLQVAEDTQAGWLYSDFRDQNVQGVSDHPVNDYQLGSIRDTFDFGQVVLLDVAAARVSWQEYGEPGDDIRWGGLYDLRLKLSVDFEIMRIPEPLYTRAPLDLRASGEKLFDYVNPSFRDYQIEMEALATAHLQRINAFLEPQFAPLPACTQAFPVEASVIIPVRNRVKTIGDAVKSALAQKTDFAFNVIVVDNHSTDGTTELLRELAAGDARCQLVIPQRTDYGIGGCWNEAIFSEHCGRYAVQLDSDDIYSGDTTMQRIVDELRKGYAMVVGSYTIVDFDLNELPPGLIDHREWTRDNGRNNALRINGLGAPRAFDVNLLREIGLPNTSYGEDYAVALRLSRQYELGRIYACLYFARRWSGNSDSALPLVTANRYDAYKDRLRTIEIQARQSLNAAVALDGKDS